jgi:hypothetical protein
MALGYIRPLSGSTSIQAERQIPETHHWQRYWRHRRNRGDHFGNCPVCGTYLDMRGIDQVLVHVHDAEIETSEGSETPLITGDTQQAQREMKGSPMPRTGQLTGYVGRSSPMEFTFPTWSHFRRRLRKKSPA